VNKSVKEEEEKRQEWNKRGKGRIQTTKLVMNGQTSCVLRDGNGKEHV